MSKRLIMILTLAFVAGIAFAAYAEVQNVKVSGDLGISALSRDQFDLTRGVKGNTVDDSESLFISQARLRIDADLTDNVAATVRLINERMWGDTETTMSSDIDLDLAYVSMKEFLYSPLSLTIGRQELRFGNGLVIGNANASTNIYLVTNGVPTDLSLRKAFDGIKAVLNYDPLMIDVIYAKISETSGVGGTKVNGDTNLYGVNAAYNLGRKNAKVEGYALNKIDSTTDKGTGSSDNIKTVGMLFSASPIENLFTSLEGAYQFGHSDSGTQHKKRAYAIELISNYALLKVKFTPSVGFTYAYLSGDKNSGDNRDTAWDSMYYDQAVSNIAGAILPFSDVSVYSLNGNAKLREDLKVSMIWAYYRLNQRLSGIQSNKRDSAGAVYSYAMNWGSKNLGYEIDLTGTYDYTEDVQLGLTFGYFNPDKAFAEANRRDATQLIGSMKVTF